MMGKETAAKVTMVSTVDFINKSIDSPADPTTENYMFFHLDVPLLLNC